MREILFRAKRLDNGEWVEGYYYRGTFSNELKTYIKQNAIDNDEGKLFRYDINYEVDTNTLCQYTGLTDKNGLKIWENDILKANLDEDFAENTTYEWVKWYESGFYTYEDNSLVSILDIWDTENFEVCGNVFDNPELLGSNSAS